MKKTLFLLLVFFVTLEAQAQALAIAKEFGNNLRKFALTDSIEYRDKVENLFNSNKGARIADELVFVLVSHSVYPHHNSYELDTYLNLIEKDSLDIEFSDFIEIENSLIESDTKTNEQKSRAEYVSCRLKVRGTVSLDTRDLIIIRNGRITKIDKYPQTSQQ